MTKGCAHTVSPLLTLGFQFLVEAWTLDRILLLV